LLNNLLIKKKLTPNDVPFAYLQLPVVVVVVAVVVEPSVVDGPVY
jgi:hypothetical protein